MVTSLAAVTDPVIELEKGDMSQLSQQSVPEDQQDPWNVLNGWMLYRELQTG